MDADAASVASIFTVAMRMPPHLLFAAEGRENPAALRQTTPTSLVGAETSGASWRWASGPNSQSLSGSVREEPT